VDGQTVEAARKSFDGWIEPMLQSVECASKEHAPLLVEILKEFLSMEFKLRASLIIACPHMVTPLRRN
jgi:hypothetical protein